MIVSFADSQTAALFRRERVKKIAPDVQQRALRKLIMLDAATQLKDLLSPPANRLEALKGDRARQHSIRINDQWRICFVWSQGRASKVEIVDYH